MQHAYTFSPYPQDILLTRCTVFYASSDVISKGILQQLYHQVYKHATDLWSTQNNHGLDAELNLQLMLAFAMSEHLHDLEQVLREYTAMEIQNDHLQYYFNENRVYIHLA